MKAKTHESFRNNCGPLSVFVFLIILKYFIWDGSIRIEEWSGAYACKVKSAVFLPPD